MRPVFFGENAQPELQYQIDAWHPQWLAGLEIEAGRAWMGNAVSFAPRSTAPTRMRRQADRTLPPLRRWGRVYSPRAP